ncbi:MAG TPA: hypothetical protein PKB06_06750 [Actinotalea sp.]|nr:hypothetical protein [Actinotalea sp.]
MVRPSARLCTARPGAARLDRSRSGRTSLPTRHSPGAAATPWALPSPRLWAPVQPALVVAVAGGPVVGDGLDGHLDLIAAAVRPATDAGWGSLMFGIGLLLFVACVIGVLNARQERRSLRETRGLRGERGAG